MITQNVDSPNKLWKSLKKILPGKSKDNVTMLQDEHGTHTESADIANSFNRFFSSIGAKLASEFPKGLQIVNPYPSFTHVFKFESIHPSAILKQLQTLQCNKATGLDNIDARMLKDAAEVICSPLTHIMNQSLRTGIIPFSWKKAKVTPIFKGDSPISPNNYRPISVLPVCMKLFERAIQRQLVAYLKKHSVLCEQQSGFRERHSTHTATSEVTDFILSNMDKGLKTGAVYLDLKKAFDSVDSETLLFKLQCLGIKDIEQTWFKNYVNNRQQCVAHNANNSDDLFVNCGVPQGSILGPTLFVLFINDLSTVVQTAKIVLYADDTVLLYAAESVEEIQHHLKTDLTAASDWFKNNKLHLNIAKCKWTLFGTKNKLQKTPVCDITIDGSALEHVDSYKYLGLNLDKCLSWQDHIEKLCKKLRQRLGVLRRVRPYLDQESATTLFNALVLPLVDYCDTVYGVCSKSLQCKVERLLYKGGRIILDMPWDTPSRIVIEKLKWLTFPERLFFHRCILVYKSQMGTLPPYINCKFQRLNHGYNTRNSSNLKLIKCKTNMGQRTLAFLGARNWNSLPRSVKSSPSVDVFKNELVKHILNRRSHQYFISL